MIWRTLLWFLGLALILVCLSVPVHPLLGLVLYFTAAGVMLPACIRVRV